MDERNGASHRVMHTHAKSDVESQPPASPHRWKGSAGNVTSMAGTLTGTASDLDEHEMGQELSTWAGKSGHVAQVENRVPMVGGADFETYEAGPFRTQRRAQIAAEALGSRIYKDAADPYRRGTQFLSHAEMHYDGP
jgi:hypothetical protein